MTISLKDQIAGRCIHFNGLMNEKCNLGVMYDDVKIRTSRPYKVPCLLNDRLHGGHCSLCEFPSATQLKREVTEIEELSLKTITACAKVKDHFQKTGEHRGKVECPECQEDLNYTVSNENGHIWGKCSGCDIGWME